MLQMLDLTAQYHSMQAEIDAAVQRVLESGHFVLGPEVEGIEKEISAYLGTDYAIGCASGTDALVLALRGLRIGPGDEVIIPAYTFFATAGAVLSVGAAPVFADIEPRTYALDLESVERCITPRTRAVIPVHLYGHPADMVGLLNLMKPKGIQIIEDNAQAFGAETLTPGGAWRKTGSIGEIGCLSFYPTKNLGCFGDGGMVVTSDPDLAERVRMLHVHGWKQKYFPLELGYNSRLDAMQAAILRAKLPHVDKWNTRRAALAQEYCQRLQGTPLSLPTAAQWAKHVYHLFVVRVPENGKVSREAIRQHLKEAGIASDVYYPLIPPLTGACAQFGYQPGDFPESERASRETLAIPLYPEMTVGQLETVVEALKTAF